MPEFTVEYADSKGAIREETASADSAQALRRKYIERGILVRSVQARRTPTASVAPSARGRIDLQQFVVFNEQFLALIRAGMPIPQSLELLAGNVRNKALANHLAAVRDDVKVGVPTSRAFANRQAFPPIYITSLLAGERSGALAQVLERYVTYQKLTLAIRKKILVSLIYPSILITLVIALVVFLVTFVVPEFAALYETMNAALPVSTQLLVGLGTASRDNWMWLLAGLVVTVAAAVWVLRSDAARISLERITFRAPVIGKLWIRYHVAQVSRLLGTLLTGGIPLIRALDTASESMGSGLLRAALVSAQGRVHEGRSLTESLSQTGIFPPLAIEMVRVGESTGALPAMLESVAEFFDEEVQTKTTALLNLIEPTIMIGMGIFVAFVLISLYLPIFSLAGQL